MDRLNFYGPLAVWRERFFSLDEPITLTPVERDIVYKYVSNIWHYKNRSPRGRIYVCRASKRSRPVDKTQASYHVPPEKQRNRRPRDAVPCPASMLETVLPDGQIHYQRRGKPHTHDLAVTDESISSVPCRELERTRRKRMSSTKKEGAAKDSGDWERMMWESEDGKKRVRLTYEDVDVAGMYQSVKSKAAGAVVLFSGCTRDNSVPEGEYVAPAGNTEEAPQTNGHAHTITDGTREAGQGKDEHTNDSNAPERLAASRTTLPQAQNPTQHHHQQHATPAQPQGQEESSGQPSSLPVASLTYTSYIPLALKTLQSIAEQIHTTYKLQGIAITHRLGTVPVGEESVVICVSAGHRKEAWRAGEWALEEVKKRVEIWKWEVFEGAKDDLPGPQVWRSNVTDNRIRAERQGQEGQQKYQGGQEERNDDVQSPQQGQQAEQDEPAEETQEAQQMPSDESVEDSQQDQQAAQSEPVDGSQQAQQPAQTASSVQQGATINSEQQPPPQSHAQQQPPPHVNNQQQPPPPQNYAPQQPPPPHNYAQQQSPFQAYAQQPPPPQFYAQQHPPPQVYAYQHPPPGIYVPHQPPTQPYAQQPPPSQAHAQQLRAVQVPVPQHPQQHPIPQNP